MQAFRAAGTVGTGGELHLPRVPFRPGSVVEIIVLEQAKAPTESPARERELSPERQQALEFLLSQNFPLGGRCPSRDKLHER